MPDSSSTIQRCPICESNSIIGIFAHGQGNRHRILDRSKLCWSGCQACGVVFQSQFPTEAELNAYYSEGSGWDGEWVAPNEDEDFHNRKSRANRLAKLVTEASGVEISSRPRVLDFGCGFGTILDEFKSLGWETAGIEPGPRGHDHTARNHEMIAEVPTDNSFDLIIATNVLEHVADPVDILHTLRAGLNPTGSVFILVPNLGRLNEHHLFSNIFKGVHLFAFTQQSMVCLLKKAGFGDYQSLANEEADTADKIGDEPLGVRLRILARPVEQESSDQTVSVHPLVEATQSIRSFVRTRSTFAWLKLYLPVSLQKLAITMQSWIRK